MRACEWGPIRYELKDGETKGDGQLMVGVVKYIGCASCVSNFDFGSGF